VSPLDISAATANADGGVKALQGIASAAKGKRDPREMEKVAKDFESVFIQKLTDEMRRTVPESGLLESGAMDQTQGIFWMQLSQELGKQGGLGLWKQLVKQMQKSTDQTTSPAAPEVKP
jgi:flagellar protein FlgJ